MSQADWKWGIERTLRIALLVAVGTLPAAAIAGSPHVAKNPYADIDWDTVNTYRANFHAHTTLSDGRADPDEMIYMYAEAGYHILCFADHDMGYTNRGYDRGDVPSMYVHRDNGTRIPEAETTWPWDHWIDESPSHIWVYRGWESSAFYPDLGEEGMLAIRGAELSDHPHMVSLFSPCGFPTRGQTDDERLACVEKHDGLAFYAHPTHYGPEGRWSDRIREDATLEDLVEYFGGYIIGSESLVGIEMRGPPRGGRMTRDRELFDHLLMAYYRDHDVFALSSDDNHGTSAPEPPAVALTLIFAEELTEGAVREAMTQGHMMAGSMVKTFPEFNRIEVNEDEQTIVLDVDHYDSVTWIVDGREHATGTTFDYSDLRDAMVRFELDQEVGRFHSQAFYIE